MKAASDSEGVHSDLHAYPWLALGLDVVSTIPGLGVHATIAIVDPLSEWTREFGSKCARLVAAAPELRASIEPEILDAAAEACERAGVFAAELADVARELRAMAKIQRAAIAKAERPDA